LEGVQLRALRTYIEQLTHLSELRALGPTLSCDPIPDDIMVLTDVAPLAALTRLTQLLVAGEQSGDSSEDISFELHNKVSLAVTV
jgi:hypothetical protein